MRKTKRGGAPTPIRDKISVAAYNDMPTEFKPSSAYESPSTLREFFLPR